MTKVLQLILKSFQGLHDNKGLAFVKRVKILEIVTKVRSFAIVIDHKCNDLILHMFQCFLA